MGNALIKDIRKLTMKTKAKTANLAKEDPKGKSTALYCDASIKNIQIPLIINSGSAGSIISVLLLKDLDMEISRPSNTVIVNVNGEKHQPLGAVTKILLKI